MGNKTHERTRERIQAIVDELDSRLGDDLGYWDITHRFAETYDGDEGDRPEVHKTTAVTAAQWEYRTAQITWHLPVAAGQDDYKLRAIAVHEYVHVLLGPISDLLVEDDEHFNKLNEFVTECIARVILTSLGYDAKGQVR